MLHRSLPSRIDSLARVFADARPFRHVVVDEFLEPAFCQRLLNEFPGFDEKRALNEFGEVGRKAVVPDLPSIGPAYRDLDRLLKSADFLQLVGRLTAISNLLYDPEYIGGGTHENLEGQELDFHVDFNYHPKRMWHRRLNLIVFLNPRWEESWGGCLQLQHDAWEATPTDLVTVVPLLNRAVLFETTEKSWHGFDRISLPENQKNISRKSIAVYFYTHDRPAEETAPSHATIYVPRPLPKRFESGYTLRAEDVAALQELIDRRDDQIRFLYEREQEFTQALTAITQSVSFRAGRALTWPVRKLRRSS